jgi:hypothetical protein
MDTEIKIPNGKKNAVFDYNPSVPKMEVAICRKILALK